MKLTIGMAHFDDYEGLYATIQALRLYHLPELNIETEIIIVDNNPTSNHGKLANKLASSTRNIKYLTFTDYTSTAKSRNIIFEEASGDIVLCMDCHVMLQAGSLRKLVEWYKENPESKDIISGPLLYDNLASTSTHFNLKWRKAMWGTWGHAWKHEDGRYIDLSFHEGKFEIHDLTPQSNLMDLGYGDVEVSQITKILMSDGWRPVEDGDEPFQIPAQGLGMFACRKEAWPGFNEHFRKFGGEEGYIHDRIRENGGYALCMPFLKWNHRFGRPNGTPYPLDNYNKLRNYILGHKETGRPIQAALNHFRTLVPLTPHQTKQLVQDPEKWTEKPPQYPPLKENFSFEDLTEWIDKENASLMRPHYGRILELAKECESVYEISQVPYTSIPLLEGCSKVTSEISKYQNLDRIRACALREEKDWIVGGHQPVNYDMAYVACLPKEEQMRASLKKAAKANKYCVIHFTQTYGHKDSDGGLGYKALLEEFFRENSEWKPIEHSTQQTGMTILAKNSEQEPVNIWPPGYGPGTELKKMLSKLGIKPTKNCKCNQRAADMDRLGDKWCSENVDTIVGWLQEEATRLGIPFFSTTVAAMVVKRAIRIARKKQKKGARG